jgi:hypothetical protein
MRRELARDLMYPPNRALAMNCESRALSRVVMRLPGSCEVASKGLDAGRTPCAGPAPAPSKRSSSATDGR